MAPPDDAEKKADETGPGFQVSPDGGALLVKKWWYEKHFKGGKKNATAMAEVLDKLAAGPMPWITKLSAKERADAAGTMTITASFRAGKEEAVVNIRASVYANIGLPPGVSFQWDYPPGKEGEDGVPTERWAQCIVRLSEVVPNVGSTGAQASAELVRQVISRLEADVGLTANGVIKADQISKRQISGLTKTSTQTVLFAYACESRKTESKSTSTPGAPMSATPATPLST